LTSTSGGMILGLLGSGLGVLDGVFFLFDLLVGSWVSFLVKTMKKCYTYNGKRQIEVIIVADVQLVLRDGSFGELIWTLRFRF
jgi:hypothetical protein